MQDQKKKITVLTGIALIALGAFLYKEATVAWPQIASVVGVNVGVEPNPYNTLATQIQQRENDLVRREEAVAKRESITISEETKTQKTALLSLILGSMLFTLILLNFYFDWKSRV